MRLPNPFLVASTAIVVGFTLAGLTMTMAQESYESWPPLVNPFPSTGGGGVMIGGYDPVVTGDKCNTAFTAIGPDGVVNHASVSFDAVPTQGGILCTNGKWRTRDGSAEGTTPFRVFITKDGSKRASP